MGGDIVEINHLLFFILPNTRVGGVNNIFFEQINSPLSEINFQNSIHNSYDKLHSYQNILSYFDDKKFLTTIDISSNNILLNQVKILNTNSRLSAVNSLKDELSGIYRKNH